MIVFIFFIDKSSDIDIYLSWFLYRSTGFNSLLDCLIAHRINRVRGL